jgi:predicted nucleotidyltransferase
MEAEHIIRAAVDWAEAQPAIQAVAVVGSYARGTARSDSDIDFVLLATNPNEFRVDAAWPDAIDWNAIGARPMQWEDEDHAPENAGAGISISSGSRDRIGANLAPAGVTSI